MSLSISRYEGFSAAFATVAVTFALALIGCSPSSSQVTSPSTSSTNSSAVPLAGGWHAADQAYGVVPRDAQDAFDKALEGYAGVSLKPVAIMGTQVVAGTNYMFLCEGSKVVQNPKPELYVVKVYQDLNGNADFTYVEPLSPLGK